jgi:hypothetical protein
LSDEQKADISEKQIDIYRVVSNPFYFEEMNSELKKTGKRNAEDYLNANWGSKPSDYALKSVSAYSLSIQENGAPVTDPDL